MMCLVLQLRLLIMAELVTQEIMLRQLDVQHHWIGRQLNSMSLLAVCCTVSVCCHIYL